MFLHDWAEHGMFQMIADFEGIYITHSAFNAHDSTKENSSIWQKGKAEMRAALDSEKYKGIDVLLAAYTYEDYSGSAIVLFKRDGVLYEVSGSHCSCYGLENQWDPEKTTPEALLTRRWYCDGVDVEVVRDALKRGGYAV